MTNEIMKAALAAVAVQPSKLQMLANMGLLGAKGTGRVAGGILGGAGRMGASFLGGVAGGLAVPAALLGGGYYLMKNPAVAKKAVGELTAEGPQVEDLGLMKVALSVLGKHLN